MFSPLLLLPAVLLIHLLLAFPNPQDVVAVVEDPGTTNASIVESPVPLEPLEQILDASPSPTINPLLAGVPSGLRPSVNMCFAMPTSSEGYNPKECIAIYETADVFYWQADTQNTACLSSLTAKATPPFTPDVNMESPSIYIVYPVPTIIDLCGVTKPVAPEFTPTMRSYRQDELYTLRAKPDGTVATQIFDYADVPCPPPEIADQLEPGALYHPVLVPPFILATKRTVLNENSGLGPAESFTEVAECTVQHIKDPPGHAVRVRKVTGPEDLDMIV